MTLLTLIQSFGTNCTQDSMTFTIQKSDLVGLIPNANNTANSLLAAIINTVWQQYEGKFTDQNGIAITDQNGIIIVYDNHLYYSNTWVQFWGYLFPKGYLNSCFLYSQLSPYAD